MKKIIFLRVAWMKRYRGHKSYDTPVGGGKHIEEYRDGGEVYNYMNVSGKAFAYTRPESININKLGASSKDESVSNVTVVWFAKNPDLKGQFIVGWFKNATIFRKQQEKKFNNERKQYPSYIVTANYSDCKLISEKEREFELFNPKPGQNFVWFGHEHFSKIKLNQVWNYINSDGKILPPTKLSKRDFRAFQQDIETKKKVEVAAMNAAINYFERRRYKVDDVHSENKGWDIEASKAGSKINIEVKGLSGSELSIELTANEFTHFKKKSHNYFIFVLRKSLSKKPISNLFRWRNNKFVDLDDNQLDKKIFTSARLWLK